jgi:hypothetical protein
MADKKQLSEDLKRFNAIMGYDVTGKKKLNEAPEDEEGGDEFDFADETPAADEEGGEEGNADFDFGDEGSPEDEGGEEMEDEFGTADEFSAADDIESDEEVEEIDVTDIVKGSEEAKETAEMAAQASQETTTYVKDMADKLSNLEAQLAKMDSIMDKVSKIESDIKTPEEQLQLRSLDSYPFNMKLTDYWEEKAQTNPRYKVADDEEEQVYKIKPEDLTDYSDTDIKNSFNPEA